MLTKILKRDLFRRKGINTIVFIFILLATIFLSTSLNNILSVSQGIEYFVDKANIPDYLIQMGGEEEHDKMMDFLAEQSIVSDFSYDKITSLSTKNILVEKDGKKKKLKSNNSISLGDVPEDYCKVFDEDDQRVSVTKDEVVISNDEMVNNDLENGDELTLKFDNKEYTYTIKSGTKDVAFGGGMSGMTRVCMNKDEYEKIISHSELGVVDVFFVTTNRVAEFEKMLNKADFKTITISVPKSQFKMLYSMEMVLAALLILVGICFILIAFLVLRFTLVFTMEENYSEIGIMQAIGVKNFTIRQIYLVKYLLLVVIGAALGLVISIPVTDLTLKSVSKNIVLPGEGSFVWANIAGAVFVIFIVLLFCYGCTRKIGKLSAVTIIRGGDNGERYQKRKGITLYRRKKMGVSLFLGLNDILSHKKRYFMLFFTFCICFLLISIPLNTVNTMNSDEMARKFALNPESDVFLSELEVEQGSLNLDKETVNQQQKKIENKLEKAGYKVRIQVPYMYNLTYQKGNEAEQKIETLQIVDGKYLDYSEGSAPKLANEVAISKKLLEENNWKIGDTVLIRIDNKKEKFVITGTYADYMQMGNSARLNSKFDMSTERINFFWAMMFDFDTKLSKSELIKELKEQFPEYKWVSAQDIVNTNVGNIQDTFKTILPPLTAFLCGIIALIVIMMEHLFIVREKGEIAMMKSVGFTNQSIRVWQIMRMLWIALAAMIISIPLSLLSNEFLLKPVFAIMGAEVNIQVDMLQAYVIYPCILFAAIIIATIIASFRVRAIRIQDLNNLE